MGILLDDNNVFKNGKYEGEKLIQVAEDEPSYIRWVLQDSSMPLRDREKRELQQHLAPAVDGRGSFMPEGYYRATQQ